MNGVVVITWKVQTFFHVFRSNHKNSNILQTTCNFEQTTQDSRNWKARPHGGGRERAEAKSWIELAAYEVPRREGGSGEAGEAVQGEAANEHGGGKGVGGK